jgi:hypothetical protein
MGYESSVPSMLPAASNIGLKDATKGVKSKLQTVCIESLIISTISTVEVYCYTFYCGIKVTAVCF